MYDILIIGAGPAGISAAIYALRNDLKVGIFEGEAPGGKMVYTATIENYPGYEMIAGPDLAYSMFNQIMNLGADYIGERAETIRKENGHFVVRAGKDYKARTVIIATGTRNRKLEIPGEERLTNKGISWCAICDGALYRNKEVAVIGGGNSAFEESIYLSGVVKKVYLIHRREDFRADRNIVEKVKGLGNVEMILNTVVLEFIGEDGLEKLILRNVKTGEISSLEVEGCFEFVGLLPATEFVRDLGITDEDGYIPVSANQETKIPGLYAVGDVVSKRVRQIVTAVNDGAIAALDIIKKIR
ncbi:MAG: thioredoxin-disulfide reductase [Bacilli bacterium]|jgi:thioredoxin reductase (NADPH)|nr:thioredoxin-disulfide reductase [Acholeplasmataceae bacterium]